MEECCGVVILKGTGDPRQKGDLVPGQKAARHPGADPLKAGRDRIIAGATCRGLLAGFVAVIPAVSAALLLASEDSFEPLLAVLLLLGGGSFFAYLSRARAGKNWARAWDLQLGLPQTVETTAVLCARETTTSDWGQQLLLGAAQIPPPTGASTRLAPSPRLLPTLLITAIAISGAILLPGPSDASTAQAPRPDPGESSTSAGASSTDATGIDRFEEARRLWKQRHDAALILAGSPRLAPLHDWLERGGPAPMGVGDLTSRQRQQLREAARRLQAGAGDDASAPLQGAARYLQSIAEGQEPQGVQLPDASGELRDAASMEIARTPGSPGAAAIRDPDLASGGGDSPTTSKPPDGTSTSALDEPSPPIEGSRPVAPGERSVQDRGSGAQGVASPQWDRVLAHPEVETRWLPAIEAYRQLEQSTGEEPR